MSELSHLDPRGRARMVDVGHKPESRRAATASASVRTTTDVVDRITRGGVEKGDVLAVARVAGIMAAKRTAELIPLCHPLGLDAVAVDLELSGEVVRIRATVRSCGRTGVEMEALTAAAVASLAVYDMCKSLDRSMVIEAIQLEEKSGGKSGHYVRNGASDE